MDKLEANTDGNIVVDLGTSNSARLTAMAAEDPDLYAGASKKKTWLIEDADDAEIADGGYWFTVNVAGVDEEPGPEPEPEPEPEPTPTASFEMTSVSIDEGEKGSVSIDAGEGVESVMVKRMSGAAMIGLYQGGSALEAGDDGNYAVDPSAEVTISSEIDESLMDGELKQATLAIVDAEAYDVGDNGMVTITVNGDSDKPGPIPTVSFVSTALTLKEGASSTVRLLRNGEFRGEPGTVMVSMEGMEGDAVLSLSQSGDALADDGAGNYTVKLAAGVLTDLTVTSDSDPDLADGAEKSATLTLSDGYGAEAGDSAAMLTVTVIGSTAVPALPLIGQLLLALFLMAGGARLYRRRRG